MRRNVRSITSATSRSCGTSSSAVLVMKQARARLRSSADSNSRPGRAAKSPGSASPRDSLPRGPRASRNTGSATPRKSRACRRTRRTGFRAATRSPRKYRRPTSRDSRAPRTRAPPPAGLCPRRTRAAAQVRRRWLSGSGRLHGVLAMAVICTGAPSVSESDGSNNHVILRAKAGENFQRSSRNHGRC